MKLSREQIERVQKEAEAYKSAAEKAGSAGVELWKARIDMSIALGEVDSIDDMLGPGKVFSWIGDENCSCHTRPSIGMEEVEHR